MKNFRPISLANCSFKKPGRCWICNKEFMLTTVIISAALWSLWKLINEMCFQNLAWKDAGELPRSISMVPWRKQGISEQLQLN
jgi:hypothetical protein